MTTETTTDLRQAIAQALSRAGSFCGQCGFEPGDTGCLDCRRHWDMCADELLPVFAGGLVALAAGYERTASNALPGDRPDWYAALTDVAVGLRRMANATAAVSGVR